MRKFGLIAAMVAAGLMAGQAMGAGVVFYLSDVPLGAGVPTPINPQITLELYPPEGPESVTWYLWAQFSSGTSTCIGMDYAETNAGVVTVDAVSVWNGIINPLTMDPEDPTTAMYRWNGSNVTTGDLGGYAAVGGFNDPQGVNAAGLTSAQRLNGDPTWRGATPYQWYVGEVTFTAAQLGETDIFLTINDTLMIGNTTLIGTNLAPNIRFGAGEANSSPVSVDGATYYVASGVTGAVADAHITVIPEPGSLALLALGGLALIRRR